MPDQYQISKLAPDDVLYMAENQNLIGEHFRIRHRFPAPYNRTLLALDGSAGLDAVRAVNDFLLAHELPGELRPPAEDQGPVRVAEVVDIDAETLHQVLERGRDSNDRLPRSHPVRRHHRGTFECGYYDSIKSRDSFSFAGRAWGHGFAFLDVDVDKIPRAKSLAPVEHGRRPVIALLDTGVDRTHPFFPTEDFLIEEWAPSTAIADTEPDSPGFRYTSVEASHGTFIAGLIRKHAPTAQVRSLKIMRTDGGTDEHHIIEALDHVRKLRRAGDPVDAVQMSFGRTKSADVDNVLLDQIEDLLRQLAGMGVKLVASAGNDGGTEPCYPAAFAADGPDHLAIHSVGSGPDAEHPDEFSNRGDWVTDWFKGSKQRGPVRGGRYGEWSGTSFSVPRCTGKLLPAQFS